MGKIKIEKKGSRKETILRKAAMLFRDKGYAGTSMRELADQLGIEAPSLYNYIGGKDELLQNICEKVAVAFQENMQTVMQAPLPADKRLETLIRFHIKMMLQDFDELFVANHEWKQLPEPNLHEFLRARKKYENNFIDVIKEGMEKRIFQPINPYVVTLSILSAVRGLEFWHRHRKAISTTSIENDMVHHLLKGLMK